MSSYAKSFVSPITACDVVVGSGSCLLVAPLRNCAEEPDTYLITNTVAIAAAATTATLQLTSVTRDGDPVTPVPADVYLREGSRLYFGTNFVTLREDATVTSAAAIAVDIEPAVGAIAAAATAQTWALYLLDSTTDLPINLASSSTSNKKLKNGLQGGTSKTEINLNVDITYFASPLDLAQQEVMLKAATTTEYIYAVVIKTDAQTAFGKFEVQNLNSTGNSDLITYTASLVGQPDYAVTYRTANPKVNDAAQLVALNAVSRLSGVPAV